MALFNFKSQFVDPILDGTKVGTIRKYRKYPCKVGDTMYLYTGLRSRYVKARKLKEAPCVEVWDIVLHVNRVIVERGLGQWHEVRMITNPDDLNEFAVGDGFVDWRDMIQFWEGDLPFIGFHARWERLRLPLSEFGESFGVIIANDITK